MATVKLFVLLFFTELSANKTGNVIKYGLLMIAKVGKQGYLESLSVMIMNELVKMPLSVPIVG